MMHSPAFTPENTAKLRAVHLAARINREDMTAAQRAEKRAKDRAYQDARYARIKAAGGVCLQCKCRPSDEGFATCSRCRKKRHQWNQGYYARRHPGSGRQECSVCGDDAHNAKTCPGGSAKRCKCGLLLPCNNCLPTIESYASSRRGS